MLMDNKYLKFGLAFILAGVVITLVLMNVGATGDGGGFISAKNKIKCDITVSNPYFTGLKLNEATCEKIGTCYLSLAPLGIFSDSGAIKVDFGDAKRNIKISVNEGGTEIYNTELCTNNNEGTVRLTNDNGELVKTVTVRVQ